MNQQVVLCADAASLENPGFLGLDGECLLVQPWLKTFSDAFAAREYLRSDIVAQEVWVASSDTMDPINLAAALKKDSGQKEVCLLAFEGSGSLKSRAHAACIDETLSQKDFITRYIKRKQAIDLLAQEPQNRSNEVKLNTLGHSKPLRENLSSGKGQQNTLQVVTSQSPTHIFPVVSASGGTGKSTIAALTALFAQGFGYRTVLVDADLQFGDMRFLFGDNQAPRIDELIQEPGRITRLRPTDLMPALITAPLRVEESEEIVPHIPTLIERLKTQFDVIVINTGAFWAEQHLSLLELSTTALFVLDQRPSSLRGSKQLLDLCARCGVATRSFSFVLNRCFRNAPLTSIDVSCALQGVRVVELQDGGREVEELLGTGMPQALIETRNNLCLSIEEMLMALLPNQDIDQKNTRKTLFPEKRLRLGRKRRKVACL